MAVVALTSQLVDVLLDPPKPTPVGSGNAGASETVVQLQGTSAAAMGHAGSLGPVSPTAISQFRGMYNTASIAPTGLHLHAWVRDIYPVRAKTIGGVSLYLFSTTEALYYATGTDVGYAGGWFHIVVNIDPTGRAAVDLGSLGTGNITRVGYCGNLSASKAEAFLQNCYIDAIRTSATHQGLTFTGGTPADPITFLQCAAADTNSYGIFRNIAGAFILEGSVKFGGAALTTALNESLVTLSFANFTTGAGATAVAASYYEIRFESGTTGATNMIFTDVTWKGVSRGLPFDFSVHPLSVANGDSFSSTRSTYIFAGQVVLDATYTSVNDKFIECASIEPNSTTLTSPSFTNCDSLSLTVVGSSLSGGQTLTHNTLSGVGFVSTDSLSKISGHSFDNTGGTGHAITITAAGTYTLSNTTFTGYGASGTGNAAIRNTSGGLVTINISGGNTPTVTNTTGSSTVVNNSVTIAFEGVTQGTSLKVVAQETVGTVTKGQVLLQAFADSAGSASNTGFNYEPAFDPLGLLTEFRARNSGICVAALALNGAVLTDETQNANSPTTNDMNLWTTTPVVGDSYYFGNTNPFLALKLDLSIAMSISVTAQVNWEYWDGATWVALPGITDGTAAFQTLGENKVIWTNPSGWAVTTIAGSTQGALYYVRAAYVTGVITTAAKAKRVTLDSDRYIPFTQTRRITSAGITVSAQWVKDTIATF